MRSRPGHVSQAVPLAVVTVVGLVAAGVSATPAVAADHTVSVSGTTRSGETRALEAGLVNLDSGRRYAVNAGRASVPAGRYAVAAYIVEYPTLTVGARTIAVDKDTTVAFDAAEGTRISLGVNDPAARPAALAAVPMVQVQKKQQAILSENGLEQFRRDPKAVTYVIPSPGSKEIRLGVHGVLLGRGEPNPVRYDLARSYAGLPSSVSITADRQDLARVDLTVATIDANQSALLGLIAQQADGKPLTEVDLGVPVLGAQVSYRSPGRWGTRLVMNSQVYSTAILEDIEETKQLEAGRTYRQSWGSGVWAPRSASPAIFVDDGTLRVGGGPPICAFSGQGVTLDDCQLQTQEFTYRLFRGKSNAGQLLGQGESVSAQIDDSKPQWYTAEMLATRTSAPPGPSALSTTVMATWTFQAGGETRTKKKGARRP